jgi:hypothetical protein
MSSSRVIAEEMPGCDQWFPDARERCRCSETAAPSTRFVRRLATIALPLLKDGRACSQISPSFSAIAIPIGIRKVFWKCDEELQIPVHCGQSFRRIADSIPVIADSFS